MTNSALEIYIAVDAMGGDNAPRAPIMGSVLALERHPMLRIMLFGDRKVIKKELFGTSKEIYSRISIEHCTEVISPNDKPSSMIRKGLKSSMNRALMALNSGDCVGMVSAGNTGALMALSLFGLRCLDGIERPALGRAIPTQRGASCILDLGANIQFDEKSLIQYAVMGTALAETVLNISEPSIGMLNIGTEEIKGPAAIRQADKILSRSHLNYKGFIEGCDILKGNTDVIICDGFSGNVALKTIEGVFRLFKSHINEAFHSSIISNAGGLLSKKAITHAFSRYDPVKLEGAALLGLKKTVVKAHGGTSAEGFSYAISNTLSMGNNHLEEHISHHLERIMVMSEFSKKPEPENTNTENINTENDDVEHALAEENPVEISASSASTTPTKEKIVKASSNAEGLASASKEDENPQEEPKEPKEPEKSEDSASIK